MKVTASVDRFEGDVAILMVEREKIELPRNLLPKGVKAGGWVNLIIEENTEKEAEVKKSVQQLLDDLKAGKHLNKR